MRKVTIDETRHDRIANALALCPLFRALPREHVPVLVRAADAIEYRPGETILRQGEPSDSLYVIVDGEASIVIGEGGATVELARAGPSSPVGEMGLLLDEPRTATVIAASEVTALRFSAAVFHEMFVKVPEFGFGLAAGLAFRLQQLSGKFPLPAYERPARPAASVLGLLPLAFIERHRVLPLGLEGNVLTLGVLSDPGAEVLRTVHDTLPELEFRWVRISPDFLDDVLLRVERPLNP